MTSMFDNTTTVSLESVNKLVQGMNKSHEIVLQAIDKMDSGVAADAQMIYNRQGEILGLITETAQILDKMTQIMVKQAEAVQTVVTKPNKKVVAIAVIGGAYVGYKFAKAQAANRKEK